jgi:hypothetical protein
MMMKLRMMGWAGHVAPMGAKRNTYKILVRKLKEERETTGKI